MVAAARWWKPSVVVGGLPSLVDPPVPHAGFVLAAQRGLAQRECRLEWLAAGWLPGWLAELAAGWLAGWLLPSAEHHSQPQQQAYYYELVAS